MYRAAVHIGLHATEIFTSGSTMFLLFPTKLSNHYSNAFISQKIMQDIDGSLAISTLFILIIVSLVISCMTLAFLLFTLLKNGKLYHTHSEDPHPFTDELELLDGPTLTAVEGPRSPDQI